MIEIVEHPDVGVKPCHWTVTEFDRLGETGFFTEHDRLELIEGKIIEMAPIGPDHVEQVNRLNYQLTHRLHGRAIVSPQNPIVLGEHSKPQPDLVVLRWRSDFYHGRLAQAEDILLAIEVADSTLVYDRDTKVPLYARHRIPEVWIVNLRERCVDVYSDLNVDHYRRYERHQHGTLTGSVLADIKSDVDELFAGFAVYQR